MRTLKKTFRNILQQHFRAIKFLIGLFDSNREESTGPGLLVCKKGLTNLSCELCSRTFFLVARVSVAAFSRYLLSEREQPLL